MRRNIRSCNNQRKRVMNRELSELIAARRIKKTEVTPQAFQSKFIET